MEDSLETVLRGHIRFLLLDYALEHLAVDHVAYSNALVPPFLFEHLEAVSMVDSAAISLPEDPFSVLLRLYHITKRTDFAAVNERWEMTTDNQHYLRKLITSSTRKSFMSKSLRELIVNEESSRSPRPLSPPLRTRCSLKAAPKLNNGAARARLSSHPTSLPALLRSQMALIEVSDIRDEKPDSMERILNVRAHMTAEEQTTFKMLISSLPKSLPRRPAHDSKLPVSSSLVAYLACESPPPTPMALRPVSPPLFPRRSAPINDSLALADESRPMASLHNLMRAAVPLVSPKLEEEDTVDWPRENMAIVDGWAAYLPDDAPFANLPSLSPGGSSSSQNQIDELLWEASPEPDPERTRLDVTIASARLDEFEIPRVRRFGTGVPFEQEMPNIPAEMAKILRAIPMTPPLAARRPRNSRASNVPISPSMVGQPPSSISASTCEDPREGLLYKEEGIDLNNIDEVLMTLYHPLESGKGQRRAPESWIMDVKIDEKDAFLLDVPSLPEPNIRPLTSSTSHLPSGFRSFLASSLQSRFKTISGSEEAIVSQNPIQLGRVAGLAPLNIELSWRPIVSGSTVPTHEDCACVSNFFSSHPDNHDVLSPALEDDHDHDARVYLAKFQSLMVGKSMDHFSRWSEDLVCVGPSAIHSFGGHDGLILTRPERQSHSLSNATLPDNPSRTISEHDNTMDILLDGDLPIESEALHDAFLSWSQHGNRLSTPQFQSGSYHYPEDSAAFESDGPRPPNDSSGYTFVGPQSPSSFLFRNGSFDEEASIVLRDPFLPSLDLPLALAEASSSYCMPLKKKRRMEGTMTGNQNPDSLISLVKSSGFLTDSSQNGTELQTSDLPLHLAAFAPSHVRRSSFVEGYRPLENRSLLTQTEISRPETMESVEQSIARFRHIQGGGASAMPPSTSFDQLRNDPDQLDQVGSAVTPWEATPGPERPVVPQDLLDIYTLCLPYPWIPPPRLHKYIASLSLIQKRAVACALSDPQLGGVHLIERNISSTSPIQVDENEDGPDIAIDCHTAVVLVHLARLPTIGPALFKRIQELSWRFDRLAVIFEAYPIAQSYVPSFGVRTDSKMNQQERNMAPDAFGPPVRAALKRLRREITIAREIGSLCSTSIVDCVFATDPVEAAQYVRLFGDFAEQGCSAYVREEVWDERLWIGEDETADETDLASFPRMNIFAAITILSRISSDDFLDLGAGGRTQCFGDLVGADRMNFVNEELAKRLQHLSQSSSSPIPADSTLNSVTNIDSTTPAKTFRSPAEAKGGGGVSYKGARRYEHPGQRQHQMIYVQDGYGGEFLLSDEDGDVTIPGHSV